MTISQSIENLLATRMVFRRYKVGRVSMSKRGYARKSLELMRENGPMQTQAFVSYFGTTSVGNALRSMESHGVITRHRIMTPRKNVTGTVKHTTGIEWRLAPNAEDKLQEAMANPWF